MTTAHLPRSTLFIFHLMLTRRFSPTWPLNTLSPYYPHLPPSCPNCFISLVQSHDYFTFNSSESRYFMSLKRVYSKNIKKYSTSLVSLPGFFLKEFDVYSCLRAISMYIHMVSQLLSALCSYFTILTIVYYGNHSGVYFPDYTVCSSQSSTRTYISISRILPRDKHLE